MSSGCDALLAGEAGDGLRGGGFGGTEDALHGIRLAGRETFGAQHEAARGGIQADGFVREFPASRRSRRRFSSAVGNHPIGDFLGADFEQEGETHWATSAVTACCWSAQAAATATAILRTRWITPTRSVTLMAPRASRVLKRLEHLSTWS